jgi:hypothetical protein
MKFVKYWKIKRNSKCKVFGASRKANNQKLTSIGVIPIPFQFGDRNSIDEALKQSQETVVFFVTDFLDISKNIGTEISHDIMTS